MNETRFIDENEDMTHSMEIRQTNEAEIAKVLELYPLAFPDEELRPVVRTILEGDDAFLSIATMEEGKVVAHALFTLFEHPAKGEKCANLAPLGVIPSHQSKGLGGKVVRDGIEQLKAMGVSTLFVLGDPAYYQRFGFKPDHRTLTPYPIPPEYADAWQSMPLTDGTELEPGPITLPEPWMDAALWSA